MMTFTDRFHALRIRSKVLVLAMLPLCAISLLVSWNRLPNLFWESQLESARESARTIAAGAAVAPSEESVKRAFVAAAGRILWLGVLDDDDRVQFGVAEGDTLSIPDDVRSMRSPDGERRGYRQLWVARPIAGGGRVLVAWSLDRESDRWFAMRRSFTVVTLLALVIAAGLAWVMSRPITAPLERTAAGLRALTRGERWSLGTRFTAPAPDEAGEIANGLNEFLAALGELTARATSAAARTTARTAEVARAARELDHTSELVGASGAAVKRDADAQAAAARNARRAALQVVDAVRDARQYADQGDAAASALSDGAAHGAERVQAALDAMDRLAASAESAAITQARLLRLVDSISKSASAVQDIASKTALVSLNASIEAARAGEHGRPFDVVATEIQRLSRSAEATAREVARDVTQIAEGIVQTRAADAQSRADLASGRQAMDDLAAAVEAMHARVRESADVLRAIRAVVEGQDVAAAAMLAESDGVLQLADRQATRATEMSAATTQQAATLRLVRDEVQALEQVADELLAANQRFVSTEDLPSRYAGGASSAGPPAMLPRIVRPALGSSGLSG